MQPSESMIEPAAAGHGALSKNSPEHLEDLCRTHWAALDQADHHPHIVDQIPRRHFGHGVRALRSVRRKGWTSRCRLCRRRFVFLHRGFGGIFMVILSRRPQSALFLLALVLTPLVFPPLLSAVVIATPPVGLLASVGFSAAERAAQIATPGITRMSEEKNAAMPAPTQTFAPERLGS